MIVTESGPVVPQASAVRAVRNQKRALILGVVLIAASLWIAVPMGEWKYGVFAAVGVVLGTLNHLMTEYQVQKAIAAPDPVTREAYAKASLVRLLLISVLAFVVAFSFWPDGSATFVGLAVFHLIALTLTAFPLLREVRAHED